jgi:hypothetical protein
LGFQNALTTPKAVTWSSYNYPTQINGAGKTLSFLYDAHLNRYRQTYTSSTGTDWRHYVNVGGQVVAVVSRHGNSANLRCDRLLRRNHFAFNLATAGALRNTQVVDRLQVEPRLRIAAKVAG